jgi:hypothetical protein
LWVWPRPLVAAQLHLQLSHRGARRAAVRVRFTTGGFTTRDEWSSSTSEHESWSVAPRPPVHYGTCEVRHPTLQHSGSNPRDSVVRAETNPSVARARALTALRMLLRARGSRSSWCPSRTPLYRSCTCERRAPELRLTVPTRCASWRLRRRLFRQTGMCGVRLRTLPAHSATESA